MQFDQIKKKAKDEHIPIMMDTGRAFILDYIQKHEEIKSILEIGTAVGLTSMCMANIRMDIQIDTVEINEEMYFQAMKNIRENHFEKRIHVYLDDGLTVKLHHQYDFVFIDAAKSQYQRYFEHILPNTHDQTVFVFDNMAFHGIVDNPSLSHNRSTLQMTRKIKRFREYMLKHPLYQATYYDDIGDGILLVKKKL